MKERQLLETTAERQDPAGSREPKGQIHPCSVSAPEFVLNIYSSQPRRAGGRGHRLIADQPRTVPNGTVRGPGLSAALKFALLEIRRDLTRSGIARDADPDNPWLAWALHVAGRLAETRGWTYRVRSALRHGLTIALSSFAEGDVIRHSEISTPLGDASSASNGSPSCSPRWGSTPTTVGPPWRTGWSASWPRCPRASRRDVTAWARALREGTARSRSRSPRTVNHHVASALPALSAGPDPMTSCARSLATTSATLSPQRGRRRDDTIQALRSLFRFAVKTKSVFRNPVTGLTTRGNHDKVIQPLT